jgi:hypothetical protein
MVEAGWSEGFFDLQEDVMTAKRFSVLAAVIFTVVALLQLLRAVSGWELTIDTIVVPGWASWVAAVVAGVLAWLGYTVRA